MPDNVLFQSIHYPKGGLDRSKATTRQPWRQGPRLADGTPTRIYTCHEAINTRGYDPITRRLRGGSRTGLKRYLPNRVSNTRFVVQHLNTVVGVEQGVATQSSLLGRVVTGIAVSQGRVFSFEPGGTAYTEATNTASTTPPLGVTGIMQSSPNNQKLYITDGTRYRVYSPLNPVNTVSDWIATAGTLPRDSANNACRLITTYRGRTVLSGLLKDPANWFMSRVSVPTDFDYGAAVEDDPTIAVAGNNSRLGFIGDVVTALMAYSDDEMVFGGNRSIYIMRGDPLAGGEIDLITTSIGVAFGQAFTQDPKGNIYFMSNTGAIYIMAPRGGQPERLSYPIDSILQDINTGTYNVRLEWNEREKGCNVFVTSLATPSTPTTHFFWEAPNNAWYKVVFANDDHNPLASCTIDGNTPADRVVLIGSSDGYVRAFDPDATTDDSTLIASEVWLGPFVTRDFDEITLKALQAVLATASGTVNFAVYVGRTPEEALQSTAITRGTGTWRAGRNLSSLGGKIAGHALFVRLTSTNRWALESIRASFSPNLSKVRRRGA